MSKRNINYKKTILEKIFDIESIYTIHYFQYGKKFNYDGESHNFWELVYIDSGSVIIDSGNNQFTVHEGEIVFHAPNEYHNISTKDKFANSVIISFDCKSDKMNFFNNLKSHVSEKEKNLLLEIIKERKNGFINRMNEMDLDKLQKNENAKDGFLQVIKCYLELLLLSIYHKKNIIINDKINRIQISPKKLNESIIDELNKSFFNITIKELSKKLFFSETYIKQIFKKYNDKTILQYRNEKKIEEAKRLISEKKYNFEQISIKLYFSTPSHFVSVFKKHTHMTPSEYAKSIQFINIL